MLCLWPLACCFRWCTGRARCASVRTVYLRFWRNSGRNKRKSPELPGVLGTNRKIPLRVRCWRVSLHASADRTNRTIGLLEAVLSDRTHMPKDMTEVERRIRNLASVGQVVEIDAGKARGWRKSGDIPMLSFMRGSVINRDKRV